jgi:hypothetical protein
MNDLPPSSPPSMQPSHPIPIVHRVAHPLALGNLALPPSSNQDLSEGPELKESCGERSASPARDEVRGKRCTSPFGE